MSKRPLCTVSLLLVLLILLFRFLGLPLLPGEKEEKLADACLSSSYEVSVFGRVAKSEIRDDYSVLILSQAVLSARNETFHLDRIRITLDGEQKYAVGISLRADGVLEKQEAASNPGQFDSVLWNRISGIGYKMKKPRIEVTDGTVDRLGESMAELHDFLYERIKENFPEDVRGIISAMVLGDKTLLAEGQKERWQAAGISHMLAISGLHLTLLGMGLFSLLRKMRIGIRPAGIISLLFLLFYSVFTGCSVSTLRAFMMFLFLVIAKMTGRTYDSPNAIALASILILAENPWYLFYSGFQLSFAAVITCAAFRKCSRFLMGVLLYLTTLPLLLYSFSEIPLFGIFVNFILVPLLPAVLLSGIFGMVIGGAAAIPAVLLVRFYEMLLSALQKLPATTLILGKPEPWMTAAYVLLLAAGILLYRKLIHFKRRLFLFLAIPPLIGIFLLHFPSGMTLSFLDVGQGDGMVLETPSGMTALIDSGSSTVAGVGAYRVMPFLKSRGIRHLDYIFVTHMDDDHAGGIREILTAVRDGTTSLSVGTLALPKMQTKSEAYLEMEKLAKQADVRILYLSRGDRLDMAGVKISILNPVPENEKTENSGSGKNIGIGKAGGITKSSEEEPDENGRCLVLSVTYGKFDALLTGDISGTGEQSLTGCLQEHPKEYEVLKVAHHGSRFSTPEEFLSVVRPDVSVISAGAGNRYGHPHAALLKRLRACGTEIHQTRFDGEIEIHTDGSSYTVTPFLRTTTPVPVVHSSSEKR